MKKVRVKIFRGNEWKIEGDLVLKEKKVYVSKNEKLRLGVIQLHYDVLVARHKGRQKMTELVTRNYWWPKAIRDIGRYVKGCDLCQRIKNRTEALAEKLMTNKVIKKV